MNKVAYDKLLQVRKKSDLTLKPVSKLRDKIIMRGKEIPLRFRNYQVQMIYHGLLMKRLVIGDGAGLGKCATYDHLILTDKGLVEIGSMHDWSEMEPETFAPIDRDWKVLVDGEALPVKNYYYGGVKPTVKVKTRYMFETEGSYVHPLLVLREGRHEWVEMQNLKEGDYLCVERREMSFPEEEPEIDEDLVFLESLEDFPERMNPDFAYELGNLGAEIGRVPDCILQSTRKSSLAYLKGVFRSRNCSNGLDFTEVVSSTRKWDHSSSEEWLKQLQILLLRFGIVSYRTNKTLRGDWSLKLRSLEVDNLILYPKPNPHTEYFYDPIVSIEHGEAEVFDIEVDDPRHCFIGNGLVNHNTLETLGTIAYIWEKEPDFIPIIVTNKSAMRQWGGEVEKFLTPDCGYVVSDGSPEKRAKLYEEFFEEWTPDNPKFLILNYPRLRMDKRVIFEHSEGKRLLVAYDECTAFKNPKSETHKVCRQLSERAERVYGITATLLKNNLTEGYGIFKVVHPHVFKSYNQFLKEYCVTRKQKLPGKRRHVEIVVGHTQGQIRKFRQAIDPYYLGRATHEVSDELPVLTTKDMIIDLYKGQWDLYQEALSGLLTVNIDTEEEEEKETTKLTQLGYCQQIVNSPDLIGRDEASAKEDQFLDLLEGDLAGEKIIVFTKYRSMVDRLQLLLEKKGYKLGIKQEGKDWKPKTDEELPEGKGLVRVTGAESSDMRAAGMDGFTNTKNTNLIFITMAGAEALNLQEAKIMIFIDLPWSAGDYIQIVGRFIRIGSPHDRVYAIHMITKGPNGEPTIDSHVSDTLDTKMETINQALGKRLQVDVAEDFDADEIILQNTSPTDTLFNQILGDAKALKK